jgi:FkbM family methyltransferase
MVLGQDYFILRSKDNMLTQPDVFKKAAKSLLLRVFNRLENNNNCIFSQNGEKVFVENIFQFFKKSKSEKIIFDVGANIGEYLQLILDFSNKAHVPVKIHAFEPTAKCFEQLKENFKQENNILINKIALSDKEGDFNIYYDEEKSGLASLYKRKLSHYSIDMSLVERVKTMLGKDYVKEKKIEHIDFLKLDVEGHELNALKGFGDFICAANIDFIQFEYGGVNLDSHSSLLELYEFFESKNYKVAKIMKNGLEIRSYQPYMENFNYANYVAISNNILEFVM